MVDPERERPGGEGSRSVVDLESYYSGKRLLVTGVTGLLGKALLETLLRKLPDVEAIHVLVRPREEDGEPVSPARRVREEVLESSAFRRLRRLRGAGFDDFVRERLHVVDGDLSAEGLGLDAATRERLREEVDVVLHCGALAEFDAPLDVALETNALAPLRVLELAREASDPPFVAHVSTCYVNPLEGPAFETPLDPTEAPRARDGDEPYDVDREVDAVRRRVEAIEDPGELVEAGLRRARRRGWHDTYTYTKALGEQLFTRYRGDVPGLVLRPAIIESAVRSPEPGWVEGFRMMDPLIVAFGQGQLFEFPGSPESLVDIVPVDTVVNALLAAVPWTHREGGPRVYQVGSGVENPLLLKELRDLLEEYFLDVAPERWADRDGPLPDITFPETERFLRTVRLRYLLPLRLAERAARLLRLTPGGEELHERVASRRSGLEQLHRYARIYGPYAESRARFVTHNVRRLRQAVVPDQRDEFPFDPGAHGWRHYLHEIHLPGIERHLLGTREDHEEVLEEAMEGIRVGAGAGVREGGAATGPGGSEGPAGATRRTDAPPAGDGARSGGGPAGRSPGQAAAPAGERSPRPSVDRGSATGDGGSPPSGDGAGAGVPASGGTGDWRKLERRLSVADPVDPDDAVRWLGSAPARLSRRACCGVMRAISRLYLNLEWSGRHHVPERGPFIVVCNHTSHADTGIILASVGSTAPRLHPAAAEDYWFRWPAVGRLLNLALGAIPFDRRERNVSRALALPAEVLRRGHSVIFYPEGGRSVDGELRPFNSSVGLLSLATAAPILPAHVSGTHEALPKGDVLLKSRPVRIRFGPPRRVEPYLRRMDRESVSSLARELADDARDAVASLGEDREKTGS